jgi:hypothetical protein
MARACVLGVVACALVSNQAAAASFPFTIGSPWSTVVGNAEPTTALALDVRVAAFERWSDYVSGLGGGSLLHADVAKHGRRA